MLFKFLNISIFKLQKKSFYQFIKATCAVLNNSLLSVPVSNTISLPDGSPNPTMSNIMFAAANGYIIELNRSGVMAL
jgi:hypothetical protein